MIRVFNHYFRRQALLQASFDLLLMLVGFAALYLLHFKHASIGAPSATHGLSLGAGLLLANTASGLYQPAHGRSIIQSCARAALAMLLALPAAYVIAGLVPPSFGEHEGLQWLTVICAALVIAHRVYATHRDRPTRLGSRILIYGAGQPAQMVANTLRAADPHAQIVGYVAGPNETESVVDPAMLLRGASSLKDRARQLGVSEVVVAVSERRGGSMPLRELLDCKVGGIRVLDLPTYFERRLGQIRLDHVRAGWLIFGEGFEQGWARRAVKRLFDIFWALVLLTLAAPVMLLTALAVAIESKGPIFYRQERVGRDGKSFLLLKFRSMQLDAETDGQPKWAAKGDNRVTRIGALIRRFRIDEFPQLLNVLKGDMSLVGPRPERPFFVQQLTREIPYYAARHSVKPGLTGWAQVRYQYGATVADSIEKLQYDLYYIKNHALFLDTVILFETVGVVLSGKGAR